MNESSQPEGIKRNKRIWHSLSREPLLHFFGLAVLLFALNAIIPSDNREVITIDVATQEHLYKFEEDILLRKPNKEERDAIINSFLEDEILVREAKRRGFDDNARVRGLLIKNMRFFLQTDLPEPSNEDLKQFFQANLTLFETPASITYDQVFFKNPESVPDNILSRLKSGEDHKKMGNYDTFPTPRIVKISRRNIATTFGPKESRAILAIENKDWYGPFPSSYGVHFLKIVEYHNASQAKYKDIKDWVKAEWTRAKHQENKDRELKKIRSGYRVEIENLTQEMK